ncbi:glycosyltransferase family 2 protein [Pedobacter sp.]
MKDDIYEQLLIVLVLYKIEMLKSKTFITLRDEIEKNKVAVLVYDNSPQPQINIQGSHIHYVSDISNGGVSKAYNAGANLASLLNKKYLLLTDQDTIFPNNALKTYMDATRKFSAQKLFSPILLSNGVPYSPCKYLFDRGFIWDDVRSGIFKLRGKNLLNSGILVEKDVFLAIGGYDENIKLYFSDFDFVNRLKTKIDEFYIVDVICQHELSDATKSDLNSAKFRFKHYVLGGYRCSKGLYSKICQFFWLFLRAFKLSIKYRDTIFFSILFVKKKDET